MLTLVTGSSPAVNSNTVIEQKNSDMLKSINALREATALGETPHVRPRRETLAHVGWRWKSHAEKETAHPGNYD